MPRRKIVGKRTILPDPVYNNELLAKFINVVMKNGKKSVAERVVYDAMKQAATKLGSKKPTTEHASDGADGEGSGNPAHTRTGHRELDVLITALNNVCPTVEVRSRRVGGATYQVPVEVEKGRGFALAMRWLIQSARQRGELGMVKQLAGEIADAFELRGNSIKKRDDVHRMAKANQAFAHFRW